MWEHHHDHIWKSTTGFQCQRVLHTPKQYFWKRGKQNRVPGVLIALREPRGLLQTHRRSSNVSIIRRFVIYNALSFQDVVWSVYSYRVHIHDKQSNKMWESITHDPTPWVGRNMDMYFLFKKHPGLVSEKVQRKITLTLPQEHNTCCSCNSAALSKLTNHSGKAPLDPLYSIESLYTNNKWPTRARARVPIFACSATHK